MLVELAGHVLAAEERSAGPAQPQLQEKEGRQRPEPGLGGQVTAEGLINETAERETEESRAGRGEAHSAGPEGTDRPGCCNDHITKLYE